ncbi:MAG: UbiA prenyltransferase family protein [Pseudobutyrivibrio sp.]|nr:UbiA prenyltransferase family protein [Pseudobutyrivibrio sp.]
MKSYIKLLRPTHWVKNAIIFLPALCAGELFANNNIVLCLIAFIAFSLMASGVYAINDAKDYEADRLSESKKNRPVASGKISVKSAWTTGIVLVVVSFAIQAAMMFLFDPAVSAMLIVVGVIYFVLNLLYSVCGLKKVAVLELFVLAIFYVLRLQFGAVAAGIEISYWLYMVVLTGAFYIGCGKRKAEMIKLNGNDGNSG